MGNLLNLAVYNPAILSDDDFLEVISESAPNKGVQLLHETEEGRANPSPPAFFIQTSFVTDYYI